jgi:hypothetical protein
MGLGQIRKVEVMRNAQRKSKYTGQIKQNVARIPADAPPMQLVQDDPNAPAIPAAEDQMPSGDQTPNAPEATSGDQKTHKSKAKKLSNQVVAWRAQQKFPADWVITNVGENKKRGKAKDRFSAYEEGMTVAAYQQKFIDKKLGTRALATADLRWDHVAGFIQVVPPKSEE